MNLRQILESDNDDFMFKMGYDAFKVGIDDIPSLDENFKKYVKELQKNYSGNVKTFGYVIKGLAQNWIAGYKKASKDAGNKPFRMKGSSQSSASYLLGAHKRRLDRERNKPKDT